jgi:two-component system chemotaxis sensor kinase CheA
MSELTSDTQHKQLSSAETESLSQDREGHVGQPQSFEAAIRFGSDTPKPLELLSTVCQCLLQLEDRSTAPGTIDVAMGGLLRIAAEAKDAGWTDVAGLCQQGDQVLEAIRNGNLAASSVVIDVLLEMCETMALMAGATDAASGAHGTDVAALTEKLQRLLSQADATEPPAPPALPPIRSAWPAPGTGLDAAAVAEFKAESIEGLEMLEAVLLEFERNPRDAECLRAIFRVIHNIKGAADYVGLIQIKTLSHRLEDVLDLARTGRYEMTASITDLVFRSVDELKAMIATLLPQGEQDRDLAALVLALETTQPIPATEPPPEACPSLPSDDDLDESAGSAEQQLESIATCCLELAHGDASDAVLSTIHRGVTALLAAATSLEPAPFTLPARELLNAIQELRQQRTPLCERLAELRAQPLPGQVAERSGDSILACGEEIAHGNSADAVLALLVRDLTGLHESATPESPAELAKAAATFVQSIEAFRETRRQHLKQLQTLSREGIAPADLCPEQCESEPVAVPMQMVTSASADPVGAPPAKQPAAGRDATSAPRPTGGAAGNTMRVDQSKLDDYINLAGELVIARNALVHDFGQLRIDGGHHHRLKESVERVQRIVADIQANAMSMRMVPVMSVFQRFPRMVRDLAKAQGKHIEIQMFGEETELDKQVAEKLGDPLVHLIRNSADHGVELPEVRQAAGKSETGLITLKASREGGSIVIDIVDDGRGIDVERLKAKAVEKGLLRQEQASAMPREKALELIFAAGLSTAKVVSDISGRGVGMDVVRSNIADLGGSVSVLSDEGHGTRIRLQLPLTLAVTAVVLVSSHDHLYAVPMESVRETLKVPPQHLQMLNGRHAIALRGQIVPVVSLAEVLSSHRRTAEGSPGESAAAGMDRSGRVPIVVVAVGATYYGIRVDELKGQQEVVIKPLPGQLGRLPGFAGATIMGDGSVVLILDPASLYDSVVAHSSTTTMPSMDRKPA